jgi:hypothetical protein
VAQVTIYLPEEIIAEVRLRARKAQKSLSAFIGEVLARETMQEQWPRPFVELISTPGGDLAEPEDPLPEDVEP